MGPTATLLPDGARLHLQHGPIDLVIGAEGDRAQAFAAAQARFSTVLEELVAELPELRRAFTTATPVPRGPVARRMHQAARGFAGCGYLTRMAAVAGSVADEVLHAMLAAAKLHRAYVNNGGDIALHLSEGAQFVTAMADHQGRMLGRITLTAQDGIGGIATSGRHGRSLSLGVADSVTVLARTAAQADVAATLIANAVDLPGHPAIRRRPASEIIEDSDLGNLPVVTGCAMLTARECDGALAAGVARAQAFMRQGQITGAALFLQGHAQSTSEQLRLLANREVHYA